MALTAWPSLINALKNKAQNVMVCYKGQGTDELYAAEIDPATGLIPTSTTVVPQQLGSSLVYRNDNSGANITTAAYTQIVASTAANIYQLYISDSSGQSFIIATGAAASEVNKLYIPPGGSSYAYNLYVAAGTRLSVKALDGNLTTGQLIISALG